MHNYIHWHVLYWFTVYAELFMGGIFCGLKFCEVKFSQLKPPTKICHQKHFVTLTVSSMERWLLSSEKKLCARGYHIYNIWEAAVGETLVCVKEPRNTRDRYTMVVKKYGTIISHLPKKIRGFNFRGWGDPRKFEHNENSCVYSMSTVRW